MLVVVTHHAVERYAQRVRPDLPLALARAELEDLLVNARYASTPRRWMAADRRAVGRTFLYPRTRGDVAAVAENGVVVTVITRAMGMRRRFGGTARPQDDPCRRGRTRRPRAYTRRREGR